MHRGLHKPIERGALGFLTTRSSTLKQPRKSVQTTPATALHSLRFMGNAAAHEMKAHLQKELNAAFDVVEHLLYGVYVLPKQAAQLPDKDG